MKPLASLSLDLDNKWSYLKTYGDQSWTEFPSYLDIVVPRTLDFFAERNLNITYFIVGKDASLEKNHEALSGISNAGHEIGNHSFMHEPWLHLYSESQLIEELAKTEEALEKVCGQRPIGFRGPGYSISPTVLKILAERNYEYDCSVFPSYLGPLSRAYFMATSKNLSGEEREKRRKLFGKFSDGFQSLKPHKWQIGEKTLIEIPVSTMPIFKTPIHASYVIYLSTFSKFAAQMYWKTTVEMCKLTGTQLSLLLHPLDFMSVEDAPELNFFPGMNLPLEQKLEFLSEILETFGKSFSILNMRQHAKAVADTDLKISVLS
jgi:peptidoglycan-N-acetylglucosamine deacetylase